VPHLGKGLAKHSSEAKLLLLALPRVFQVVQGHGDPWTIENTLERGIVIRLREALMVLNSARPRTPNTPEG
jgi:hypothetical protein